MKFFRCLMMKFFLIFLVTASVVLGQDYVDVDDWFDENVVTPEADYKIEGVRFYLLSQINSHTEMTRNLIMNFTTDVRRQRLLRSLLQMPEQRRPRNFQYSRELQESCVQITGSLLQHSRNHPQRSGDGHS